MLDCLLCFVKNNERIIWPTEGAKSSHVAYTHLEVMKAVSAAFQMIILRWAEIIQRHMCQ